MIEFMFCFILRFMGFVLLEILEIFIEKEVVGDSLGGLEGKGIILIW